MKKVVIRLILALAIVVSLGGLVGGMKASAAGLAGWANQVTLTIDHTKIDSTLANFPVMVNLSAASGTNAANLSQVFTTLGSDANRKKIAVTAADGVTQCNVEIEKWDTASQQAVLWVKVPEVSNLADTVLFLNYDVNQADNTAFVGDTGEAAAQVVWDGSYKDVMHLGESSTGTAGEDRDSTSNGHNGTGGGGNPAAAPAKTAGRIGDGQSFGGNGQFITVPDCDDFSISTTGQLTISFWLSPSAQIQAGAANYIHYIGKGGKGNYEWAFRLYDSDYSARPQSLSLYTWNLAGGLGSGARWDHADIPNGSWVYVTGIFAPSTVHGNTELYANGTLATSIGNTAYAGYGIQPTNGTDPLWLGTRGGDTGFLNGRLDEFRVSNVVRSDAWIKADYYTQSDGLVSYSY
jgi:hypothetical protein